jgi:hypothetical protein
VIVGILKEIKDNETPLGSRPTGPGTLLRQATAFWWGMLRGLNIDKGKITNHAVAQAFGLTWHDGRELLGK